MEITQEDLRTLLISSFRYALGRRTYIVKDTINIIKKHHAALSQGDNFDLILDIKRAIKNDLAGMDCDVRDWLGLVDFLS